MRWSADCIMNTSESKFSVHTGMKMDPSKEDIALSLSKAWPVFQAMRERFPKTYDNFIEDYYLFPWQTMMS